MRRQIFKSPVRNLLCVFALSVFVLAVLSFLIPFFRAVLPIFLSEIDFKSTHSFFRIFKISSYTFLQALVSMLISVVVGIPAAYLLANKKFFGKKVLYFFGAVPLCVPPLIVVLGYISTFGMNGMFNRFLMSVFNLKDAPLKFLYSFWGIVMVQGFYNFPLVMVSVADSWKTLDSSQADSARLLGAGEIKIFFTITFRQIFPSLVSACIPVFLFCFFSFMIVLLFGAPGTSTLELEIYHAGRSSLDFKSVAILSLVETFSALAMLFLWSVLEKKMRRNHQVVFFENRSTKILGVKKLFTGIYFLIVAVFFLLPLVSIFFGSFVSKSGGQNHFSFDAWKKVFAMKDFCTSLGNTFSVAACTSLLCTVSGFFYSTLVRLSKTKRMTAFFYTLPILPMAVSSVAIGIGMSSVFKNSSPVVLVMAQTALSWPFAFRQIHSQMSKIPQTVLDSASVLSSNPLDKIFKIIIPYSWRGILSALGFCFAISAGDATLPLVLSMQKFSTLSLFTYRLAASYRFTEACVSGLILGLVCSVVFFAAKRFGGEK